MRELKAAGGVVALAAALLLSGCASMGGYDVAANGLPEPEDALRRELAHRPADAYGAILEGAVPLPDDDLVRLLFAGTAARYAGAYHDSGKLLDLASYLAEERVTTSVSQQALSMVTSDRALAYTPGAHERLMIHYDAAAAYLDAGDLDAAAVEARRIEARLDRMAGEETEIVGQRFFHTLAALIFDAAGYPDAARVAYRRAAPEDTPAPQDTPASQEPEDTMAPQGAAAPEGEVVVLVENGHVPHRVEQTVVIALPGWQVGRLRNGDAGEKAAAALEAAARVVYHANARYGDRGWYYRDRGYQRPLRLAPWDDDCRDQDGCDADPYLLRISWPVLYQPPPRGAGVRLRAGERMADAVATLDVAGGARRDFEAERATTLARTLARAVSKVALSTAAKEAAAKRDPAAGQIVGLLTNLGTLLTERADTRCWHLLPGQVRLVRLRLPAGTHDLELEVDGRTVPLGPVQVAAGRTTFQTHRIWR
ncbi:MAG: hypothetical protein ACLFRX_01715 [Gemmatimonadota bacterium]